MTAARAAASGTLMTFNATSVVTAIDGRLAGIANC
jgi:hypothetical protein